jgi:trans-2,3-dihydro-3-hydroxyanthranilate isomerase
LSDGQRCSLPVRMGTSHAVFVSVEEDNAVGLDASLRFFTAAGELPACGHGTVAALALLAQRSDRTRDRVTLRTAERVLTGWVVRANGRFDTAFDPGPIGLREPVADEIGPVLGALGVDPGSMPTGACIASVGRPRLLVPVPNRLRLAALTPDFDRLRAACDRLGLLGCYVYSPPTGEGRLAARMFAPSIGVDEDIANANSTAGLSAYFAEDGRTEIAVDMGDALGTPATITATARRAPSATIVRVGGRAAIARTIRLSSWASVGSLGGGPSRAGHRGGSPQDLAGPPLVRSQRRRSRPARASAYVPRSPSSATVSSASFPGAGRCQCVSPMPSGTLPTVTRAPSVPVATSICWMSLVFESTAHAVEPSSVNRTA